MRAADQNKELLSSRIRIKNLCTHALHTRRPLRHNHNTRDWVRSPINHLQEEELLSKTYKAGNLNKYQIIHYSFRMKVYTFTPSPPGQYTVELSNEYPKSSMQR